MFYMPINTIAPLSTIKPEKSHNDLWIGTLKNGLARSS